MELCGKDYVCGELRISGNFMSIDEIGGWSSYLEGDEDYVYETERYPDISYGDEAYGVIYDDTLIGYAICRRRLVRDLGKTVMLTLDVMDLGIDAGEDSREICDTLLDFIEEKTRRLGGEAVVFRRTFDEYVTLYSLIEERGAVLLDDGRYVIAVDNPEGHALQASLMPRATDALGECELRFLHSCGFEIGEDACKLLRGDFEVTVMRESAEILYTGPFTVWQKQYITNERHRCVLDYIIRAAEGSYAHYDMGRSITFRTESYTVDAVCDTTAIMPKLRDMPNLAADYVPQVHAMARVLGLDAINYTEQTIREDGGADMSIAYYSARQLVASYIKRARGGRISERGALTALSLKCEGYDLDIGVMPDGVYYRSGGGEWMPSRITAEQLHARVLELGLDIPSDTGDAFTSYAQFEGGYSATQSGGSAMMLPFVLDLTEDITAK